jgi:Transposase DDE domain.
LDTKGSVFDKISNSKTLFFKDFTQQLIYGVVMQISSLRLLVSDLQTNVVAHELNLPTTPYSTFRDGFSRFESDWFKSAYLSVLQSYEGMSIKGIDEVGLVKLVDGSLFPTLRSMDWASYKKRKAIRLHLSWELNRQIPTEFIAQKANSSERDFLLSILKAGTTYVADRGYFSFYLAEKIQKAEAFFILRIKKNLQYRVINSLAIDEKMPQCFKHLSDQMIQFDNDESGLTYRLICFEIMGSKFMICTNRLDLSTLQIIMLYAYRWQIELMFKFLKRTLNGIHLMNNSENGVNIQFYVLMMSVLLKMRLKQGCIQKNEEVLQRKSFVEKQKQKHMKFADLNNYYGNSPEVWIKSIATFFYEYWKIGKHWLLHLKNLITQPFDDQVIKILGDT